MKIELKGDKELIALFNEIGKNTFTEGVIRDVSRKGGMVVRRAAQNNMPYQLGDIGIQGKKNVNVVNIKQNKAAVRVTIQGGGTSNLNGREKYLGAIIRHFTDGRQNDRRTKSGLFRGRVVNRYGDFIERGFSQSKNEALTVIKNSYGEIIRKKWRKLA
jgi:hypothetical protein